MATTLAIEQAANREMATATVTSVSFQRTSEIGVRMAMGARRGTLLWMVLSSGLRLVGIGMVLGAAALYFAVRYVSTLLYGVGAFDPATLAATIAVLTIVALAAGMIPALRAARIDPAIAMRA